jgi:FkbM family methyltransferase
LNFVTRILKYKRFAHFLVRNLDLDFIRVQLGRDFLSPIQAFILDGYHDRLYRDLSLNSNSNVIILGGYEGFSAQVLFNRYSSYIYLVEPVPEYVIKLNQLFNDSKFTVFDVAVSNRNGLIQIGVRGEESGIRAVSNSYQLVECRKASEFLGKICDTIDLIEINIEGSEYEVLADLIESGVIKRIRQLLVQFHRDSIEDELKRSLLRNRLSDTHKCVFEYPWVWERWDLLESNGT